MLAHLRDLLFAAPDSIAGVISARDRARALLVALSTGNIAGVVAVLIGAFGFDLTTQGLALVTAVVVSTWNAVAYFADAYRRKVQDGRS